MKFGGVAQPHVSSIVIAVPVDSAMRQIEAWVLLMCWHSTNKKQSDPNIHGLYSGKYNGRGRTVDCILSEVVTFVWLCDHLRSSDRFGCRWVAQPAYEQKQMGIIYQTCSMISRQVGYYCCCLCKKRVERLAGIPSSVAIDQSL